MTGRAPRSWSIRRRVLAWLFAGMALVLTANLVSGYYGTREAADSAYDRLLLASASAIAERLAVTETGLTVDIPYAALDMLASTAQDRVFYAVQASDGSLVTGYGDLPGPPEAQPRRDRDAPRFYNVDYKGAPVRVVALRSFVSGANLSGFAQVRVAQTRGERQELTLRLLRQSAVWTLVIALLGAAAAWLGISVGLRPLERLGEALGRRSPEDVRPVLHDVPTEFAPLVGAVNGMLQRIDSGLSSMRRFISDASHQLRTPLAGLHAQTQMALRETDPGAVRDSLAKMDISVRRTNRLARQLLSHARAAEPLGAPAPLDLAALARDTVAALNDQARAKDIDLGYEGPDHAPMAGNATLIGELMANLADNALRYSPPSTVVTLSVVAAAEGFTLLVDDQGPGIPADRREEVFNRFVRLPGAHLAGGVEGC
ncbi:MAG: sensor histidine kinase N-terminal domain-containing protein, partial [Rhodobacterales bacterium]|nr:sensor histidine kinase N-terminal domain-containing protein [Rhodobacterales bacterium]